MASLLAWRAMVQAPTSCVEKAAEAAAGHQQDPPVSTEFLEEADIRKLTGRVKRVKQIEELHRQKIPYRINARGELVVRRNLVDKPLPDFELGPVR